MSSLLPYPVGGYQLDEPCHAQGGEDDELSETAVQELVTQFGGKLQMVSLLAPEDVLRESLDENYGGLVSPALLEKWMEEPTAAPGRLVSSPWPDRIEIAGATKISDEEYEVEGHIIEVTSVEKEGGGVAAKKPITLTVIKIEGKWVIDKVVLETTRRPLLGLRSAGLAVSRSGCLRPGPDTRSSRKNGKDTRLTMKETLWKKAPKPGRWS